MSIIVEYILNNSFRKSIKTEEHRLLIDDCENDEDILKKLHEMEVYEYDIWYHDPYIKRFILEKSQSIKLPELTEDMSINDLFTLFLIEDTRKINKFEPINQNFICFNKILKDIFCKINPSDIDRNLSSSDIEYILEMLEFFTYMCKNDSFTHIYMNHCAKLFVSRDEIFKEMERIKRIVEIFVKTGDISKELESMDIC